MGNLLEANSGRDAGTFWLANDVVDEFMPVVGVNAIAVYVCLARQHTLLRYPSVRAIAHTTRLSPKTIRASVARLARYGLLNEHDVMAINNSDQEEDAIDLSQAELAEGA